jgi:type II secretory pathway pseudopilin PulG
VKNRYLNQTGLTLIELLIVMAISIVLFTATIMAFVKQEKVMRDEGAKTNLRALGRIAIEDMTKEIRRTGFGFPGGDRVGDSLTAGTITATQGLAVSSIVAVSATSITFRGNIDEVVTTIVGDIAVGDSDVDIFGSTNFADDDNFIINDPTPAGSFEVGVVDGVPSDNGDTTYDFDIDGTFANSYEAMNGVSISQYHTIVYAYDAANNRVTRNQNSAGIVPVIGNVSGLTFAYSTEDGTAVALPATTATMQTIRKVEITLTLTEKNGNSTVSEVFNTEINLRNMK